MTEWAGFDQVKAQVRIEQILERKNLLDEMKQKGKQLVGLCPFHNDSRTPSFKVTPSRNIWRCFGCNIGGDVIDLVRQFEGYTEGDRTANRRKATVLIQEWFGITPQRPATKPKSRKKDAINIDSPWKDGLEERVKEEEVEAAAEEEPEPSADDETPTNPPLTFELKNLDPNHPYLQERGLTKETVSTFGLGYFGGKGTMHGRVVIPIHNEHGELVAYAGRWPGDPPEDESKYLLPANFRKSLVVYNLHRARDFAAEGLIITEGFFSLYALWQRGRRNVVAVMGSSVSAEQENLIVETVKQMGGNKCRVLLAFDSDEAGRRGMTDAAARLTQHCFVRTVELKI
jgi:DNA primase